jgi:hypothetical protein
MSIYLEKVEATFDQIYYEQYLEDLKEEARSAMSAGRMTDPGEFSPTIARPPKKVLEFDRTVTTPSRATTTSSYDAANRGAACDAWVSLVRYCGTTETNAKLSQCYCTSGTDNVPDQWNSLAARCAKAKYNCEGTASWKCDLTDQASSFTDYCDTDGETVRFHTAKKSTIARQTADDNWMGSSASDDDEDDESSDRDSDNDSGFGGSSDETAADAAAPQPKSTSSAAQAPVTATSASPGSTRTAHTSRTSSSSISWTLPSATSTSSAQSLSTTMDVLVYRIAQSWLLAICALWLL